ncbi:MAG TPA: hypothetical protein VG034_02325 [Acidimicrobiia bacterium]|jgi:hypothetical protein|nr:hypothetical protein [Acidimicrobiia bacterium]
MTTLERISSAGPDEELAAPCENGDGAAWVARRAAALERLARWQWEESRRSRRPRALALAATARQLHAEAQRLATVTSAT